LPGLAFASAISSAMLVAGTFGLTSSTSEYEPDQNPYRADICIGTNAFHTPSSIRDALVAEVERESYSICRLAPNAWGAVYLSHMSGRLPSGLGSR
jgi:hypothetical protein